MEKVIVTHHQSFLTQNEMSEVNCYLEGGWRVKSVTTEKCNDHVTAIFVLTNEG